MCMSCMAQADYLLTGGILGVASLRVGARSLRRPPGTRHDQRDDDERAGEAPVPVTSPG